MAPHPRYPHVFTPLTIGTTQVRNRIFMPAHTTNYGENNLPSERHLAYHRARAAGGVGLSIFEGIRVHRSSLGRQQGLNGFDPACIPRFARIADAVRSEGGRLFGQIIHLGRHIDGNFARTPAWSASDIPWAATAPPPHPMTEEEIALVVQGHADVAANLIDAGLDGIELTMSHGHLLQQFLSPASNMRGDAYGGSLENRMRFPLDTLRAVRARIGRERTLGIRISADEYLPGGLTLDDMTAIVTQLVTAVQVDFVNVSHSAYHGSYTVSTQMADMAFRIQDFQPLTTAISTALDAVAHKPVVMTACRYQQIAQAEEMLATGSADMIGMARAHIADPEIVTKARMGRDAETTPCIGCNQGCAGMLALNLAITCLSNPAAGREADWPTPALARTGTVKNVLVIGGGPGGMEAAATAAELGHTVTLVEQSDSLGGALLWTSRMPLRGEFATLLSSQQARLRRVGVAVHLNTAADATTGQGYDAVIQAIGAVPRAQTLTSGAQMLTLEAALDAPDLLGQNVTLVDTLGTWSVVSVAEWLADLGKTVTLVAPTGSPGWTISMYSGFALRQRLRNKRVRVIPGQALADFADGMVQLTDLSLGETGARFAADSVIAPLPARPMALTRQDGMNNPLNRLAVGDCQSARTALEAIYEGHEAARDL
ncbi:FAD-dependent oxidoreductase [Puniceibacterium sp. IMCC21224]|uniref:oxidoreductase n=1 Tax=Puniceibacterium sp. IMCC21224 TaxID=1618204 RepID=UPI00064DD96C|nr:FAD-dependent oxidoreductase [Puniceibacterium sp. IMCC21224]KMK64907.1 NADH:flavin oxidoreductase [Puniceibacterium sp. IMCC21224]